MATFSQGFLSSLGRPQMAQSLFGLGQTIGGLPRQAQDRRKQQQFNQLMQKGQAAMAAGDAAKLAQVGQDLTSAGYAKEGQALTQASRQAEEKQQLIKAGESMLTGLPSQMRQGAATLAQMGRPEQALEAQQAAQLRQQSKGKQALARYASSKKLDLKTPEAREGFYRIASAYEVPVADATEIYDSFLSDSSEQRTTKGEVIIRDSEGNFFTRATQYDEKGQARVVITPFPNSPKKPVGDITIVSGTTGASAFDKPGIASEQVLEEEFAKLRVEAINLLPGLESSLIEAEKSLQLLNQIQTGGFSTAIARSAQRFLGVQPADEAEFDFYAGKAVLQGLDNFKGAISNAEREYLENLYQSLERSGFANKAILTSLVNGYRRAIENAQLRADSDNFDDYNIKQRRKRTEKPTNDETVFDYSEL